MKRIFTFLMIFSIGITGAFAQNDTLVMWTFPSTNLSDTVADIYNIHNANSYIFTEGTSAISMKNGVTTKAVQAKEWENGSNIKSWQIMINTTQYGNLFLDAKLTAGGSNPGPRDFKTQYRVGTGGAWSDVPNGAVTVANDWTTGVLASLQLPVECENQNELFIRFIMTSDTAQDGSVILSSGTSKMDDILVKGTINSSLDESEIIIYDIYPNPSSGTLFIESEETIKSVRIYSMSGQVVYSMKPGDRKHQINIDVPKGSYMLQIANKSDSISVHQIIIE